MKSFIFNLFKTKLILLASALLLMSCKKSDTPDPKPEDKKWIVVYKDVILGDQNSTGIGQFFKTQTGEVLNINNAFSQQGSMSMVYFSEYYYNRHFLTFPGDAHSASISEETEENNLFDRPTVGINYWETANLNSGEINLATTSTKNMSKSEFDALASSRNWNDFDSKFKEYNGGEADLNFAFNYMGPDNGDVYMLQLNNTIRAFIYIKNTIPSGANGSSVKFDMVIEGGGIYDNDPSTKRINPAKD